MPTDTNNSRDLYRYQSGETITPDWIALDDTLPLDVRNLAHRIVIAAKGAVQPSRAQLAAQLQITPRTVDRWIAQLAACGYLSVEKLGRCNVYWIHRERKTVDTMNVYSRSHEDQRSHEDLRSTDRRSHEDLQSDQRVYYSRGVTTAQNDSYPQDQIVDRDSSRSSSISSNDRSTTASAARPRTNVRPEHITTALGRLMLSVEWGFYLVPAVELQHLDLEACKADRLARLARGQGVGAIIEAWRASPPAPIPPAAPVDVPLDDDTGEMAHIPGITPRFPDAADLTRQWLERRDPGVRHWLRETGI